jgi:tRNA threonylcarbamoyladenosine biosynthesis protein TsaB
MLILTFRTDKPEAEIGLFEDSRQSAYETWQAHRQLSETIHKKLDEVLKNQNKELQGILGIVIFEGPGSFTGLRIGFSVANALAYALEIPIVATGGEDWQKTGIKKLQNGESDKIALPKYGAPVHTTKPKH